MSTTSEAIPPTPTNPLDPPEKVELAIPGEIARATRGYEEPMKEEYDLIQRLVRSVPIERIGASSTSRPGGTTAPSNRLEETDGSDR